ncbi:MAG: hypothetical protein LH471_04685 [Salinibacterium sp.]|nr:hypothetical protein [Salinibacterium sp.]
MRIGVPRSLIVGIAALFSAYLMVLAVFSLSIPRNPVPVFVAMALFLAAATISLFPGGPARMPIWMAALNVAVSIAVTILDTSQIDPNRVGGVGYSTWHVAAVGVLMTITSTRRRNSFAWVGMALLVVQTVWWAGPTGLLALGVIGSITWVGISHLLSNALAKAARDAQRFGHAERGASDWKAAQDAHVSERQVRLGHTSAMAFDMLRRIESTGGELTAEERRECLYLERAIRDEIRGRTLLNDAVRDEVMAARRRGATVTLLDEGGIDELPAGELDRVLNALAAAMRATKADTFIARTVPDGSEIAVTLVGLNSVGDGDASALGQEEAETDEVVLWLEIPRAQTANTLA